MKENRQHAVIAVVWTLAGVVLITSITLCLCCIWKIEPAEKVLSMLKDFGLVAAGALTALLARTSSNETPGHTETVTKTQTEQKTTDPEPKP